MLGNIKTLKKLKINSSLENNLIGGTALEILNSSVVLRFKDSI
jgi:hypothetical protein